MDINWNKIDENRNKVDENKNKIDVNKNKLQNIKLILKNRDDVRFTKKSPCDEEPVRSKVKLLIIVFGVLIPGLVAVYDILSVGHVTWNVNLLKSFTLKSFGTSALEYTIDIALVLVAYVAIYGWAFGREVVSRFEPMEKVWDFAWMGVYFLYFLWVRFRITSVVYDLDVPMVAQLFLIREKIRFLMKIHAYLRVCVYRFKKDEDRVYPHILKYIYFILAPTLEFRDKYPRATGSRRWGYIRRAFVKYLIIITALSFYFQRVVYRYSAYFWLTYSKWNAMMFTYLLCCWFGLPTFAAAVYCVLHCECNVFGEILRFGDRNFYKKWWKATNFQQFNSDWNLVINGWLEINLFDDIKRMFPKKMKSSTLLSVFVTFFMSAIFHDYASAPVCKDFIANFTFVFGILSVVAFAAIGRNAEKTKLSALVTWSFNFLTLGIVLFMFVQEVTVLHQGCKAHLTQGRLFKLRLPSFIYC